MSVEHKNAALGKRHAPHNWEYADATARGAATGFVAGDVGKLARQLDDNSLWMLTDDSPVTWQEVGGGGGGTPGGADGQVQYNDGGAFGGDSGFTYNKATDRAVLGSVTLGGVATVGNAVGGSPARLDIYNVGVSDWIHLGANSYVAAGSGAIGFASGTPDGALTVQWKRGAGSPEGVVTAPVGSLYSRTDGGAGTSFYVKESGAGNTGWVAK